MVFLKNDTINFYSTAATFRPPSRCLSLSLSDVFINDSASTHGSIYSEPAYASATSEQEKICDNCRQSMSRPSTASYWYPSSASHLSSPKRYCGKLGDCSISNLRHPDGASNPNLKEEIERIPGNGASGSDPEEEYIEVKKLFNERTVTGKSDIEEDFRVPSKYLKMNYCICKLYHIFINNKSWIVFGNKNSACKNFLQYLLRLLPSNSYLDT